MLVMEQYLTVKEVAHILQYTEETVKRLLRKGALPGKKVGREWRINPDELKRFMEEQNKKPQ